MNFTLPSPLRSLSDNNPLRASCASTTPSADAKGTTGVSAQLAGLQEQYRVNFAKVTRQLLDGPRKSLRAPTTVVNIGKAQRPLSWPNNRNLETVTALYKIPISDIISNLSNGSKILDIGCGKGALAKDICDKWPQQFYLTTITREEIDNKNLRSFDEITYGAVPDDTEWLKRNFGTIALGFDTYASGTYPDNPLHSLIFMLLTLKPGGKFYCMSSLAPRNINDSCFGDRKTRKKIKELLHRLGAVLKFDFVEIESQACAPSTKMHDLRISLEVPEQGLNLPLPRSNQPSTPQEFFEFLCNQANQEIGIPKRIEGTTAFTASKEYNITMRKYVKQQSPLTSQDFCSAEYSKQGPY
jgi:SAM-dependent methyltransferase